MFTLKFSEDGHESVYEAMQYEVNRNQTPRFTVHMDTPDSGSISREVGFDGVVFVTNSHGKTVDVIKGPQAAVGANEPRAKRELTGGGNLGDLTN